MTVSISKPAINLRRELGKRVAPYSEQKFYLDNLLINGTFDTDTDWTLDAGWSISGGVLSKASGSGNSKAATQAVNFVAGRRYIVKFDYTAQGTNIAFGYGTSGTHAGISQNSTSLSGTGPKTITIAPSFSGGFLGFHGHDSYVGQIDNITVFEVNLNNDVIYTMPKGWKPKDVFEDGLLQREGASHDYEVVFDGFDYVVKPTVAPSATTETHIIGVKS
jgi:hypothetical protein